MERTKAILIDLVYKPFYYLCWPIGLIVSAARIGLLDGWDKLSREPEPTEEDIKREIM